MSNLPNEITLFFVMRPAEPNESGDQWVSFFTSREEAEDEIDSNIMSMNSKWYVLRKNVLLTYTV